MPKNLPDNNTAIVTEKLVPISKAAKTLGVSIDTIRRWDRQGKLHSTRPDGKNRVFSVVELERIKYSEPLKIRDAAQLLKVSPYTLRRYERKGLIIPGRDHRGERIYTKNALEKFIDLKKSGPILKKTPSAPAPKAYLKPIIRKTSKRIDKHPKSYMLLNTLTILFILITSLILLRSSLVFTKTPF